MFGVLLFYFGIFDRTLGYATNIAAVWKAKSEYVFGYAQYDVYSKLFFIFSIFIFSALIDTLDFEIPDDVILVIFRLYHLMVMYNLLRWDINPWGLIKFLW